MEKKSVRIKKLNEKAIVPSYGSECAAGADLYACLEGPVTIAPGETAIVPTGKPRNLTAQWMSTCGQGATSVVPEHFCRLPPSVCRGPLLHLLP